MPASAIILVLLVLLLGVVYMLRHSLWTPTFRQRLALGAATLGAIVSSAYFLAPPSAETTWRAWRDDVSGGLERCPEAEDGSICLSRALANHAAPNHNETLEGPADVFYSEVELGQNLRRIPRAADLLWAEFGIDNEEFIGTGYSVPYSPDGGARSYSNARQREFLVENLCADMIDAARCPAEQTNIWTWRLSAGQTHEWLNRPLNRLLAAQAPLDHQREWSRTRASDTSLYIRFARFSPDYYSGTLGRPDANLVFIAAYPTGSPTLREALFETGSAPLAEPGDDTETLFIWIYAPPQRPREATWGYVFEYLRQQAQQP
jgi:hypothetical protein